MGKIKCVLIDDEPKVLKLLRMYCEQLGQYCEVIGTFPTADKFLQNYKNINFDLILLDIDMKGMKGTELARLLKDKPVVFVTGRNEYDKEVLDIHSRQENIIARIAKPPDTESIEKAFIKYIKQQKKITSYVFKTDSEERNIKFDEILLVTTKADAFKKGVLNRYNIEDKFHARNKILVTGNEVIRLNSIDFPDLMNILPGDDFFCVNRSTIIAKKAIKGIDGEGLHFIDILKNYVSEAQFNVSDDCKKDFRHWYRH